jgi:hypothetical protein
LRILPGERRRSHESQQQAERRQIASKLCHIVLRWMDANGIRMRGA